VITPWEIYWVLQLDSIGFALFGVAIMSGFGCIFAAIAWSIAADPDVGMPALMRPFRRLTLYILPIIFIVAFIGNALLPSTKTAAAMIVVPQIVNSPTIQREAGDLYNLAKQALRDAIAPEHKQ